VKLHLIAVGHKMPGWINSGYDDYARRMPPDLPLLLAEIKPGHRVAGEDGARARQLEAERILARGIPTIGIEGDKKECWSINGSTWLRNRRGGANC